MTNEALFIVFLVMNLILPVVFLKGGKAWLYGYIGFNAMMLIPFAPIQAVVFGYSISVNTIMWAPLFLITDILTEKYGRKAAIGGVLVSIIMAVLFVVLSSLVFMFSPTEASMVSMETLQQVFDHSLRMVFIGTAIFFLCQLIDIYIYDFVHKKTGERFLWLRNNASTIFTTFINNILFWWLALGHILDDWFVTAMAAYTLTLLIAICDTPFIYLAKKIQPLDLKEARNEAS